MKKIAVYTEVKDTILDETAYELLSKAFELKTFAKNINDTEIKITAVAISDKIDKQSVSKAYQAGADSFVLIKNDNFRQFEQILYAKAFLSYLETNPQDYILFPATPTGRMVAPRITTSLNTGLVADCTGINFILNENELKLASTRPTFGAELMATILSKQKPECATIRPKTFTVKLNNANSGEYNEFRFCEDYFSPYVLIDRSQDKNNKISFDGKKVIFAAGFGLYEGDNKGYIEKLFNITKKLNVGFALSRKLVDFKIMSNEYQVGQTGATVSPDLYVAFGISGALQHIQGMKNSKKIIAINTDENAEIFKYADYKIVADAKKIIDELYLKI